VWQIKFSPNGTRFATFGKDNIIYIWQITKTSRGQSSQSGILSQKQSGKYKIKCSHEIKGHTKIITSLNWSYTQDDKAAWLVTTSHDSSIKVWDSAKGGRLVVEILG
jgi:WD repeat-containing protein 26